MGADEGIQFQHHPDHTVEYLGRRYRGAKLVNGVWYFREGNVYKRFPLQHEIRVLPAETVTGPPGP